MILSTLKIKSDKILAEFATAAGDIYADAIDDLKPCVVYLRKSVQKDDKDAESIAVQLINDSRRCDALGWIIVEIYVDEGISASKGLYRPDFVRMREDVGLGKVKRIMVRDQARISRDDVELFVFLKDITKHDLDVRDSYGVVIKDDLGTKVKGLVDSDYAKEVAKKVREKKEANAASGKHPKTKDRPFGYTSGYGAIVEKEAAVIREMAARALAGETLYHIVKDLTARGVRKYSGKLFEVRDVRRYVLRPENAGMRGYKPTGGTMQIVARNSCPAIFTEEYYNRLVKKFDDNKPFSRNTVRKYLLSGILICSECGTPLRMRLDRSPAYACPVMRNGCGKVSRNQKALEDYFINLTYDAIKLMPHVEEVVEDSITPQIERLQEKIDESREAYKADLITLQDFADIRRDAEVRIKSLRQQLNVAVPLPVDDADSFLKETVDKQRATILRLWGRVGVKPIPKDGSVRRFHPNQLVFS